MWLWWLWSWGKQAADSMVELLGALLCKFSSAEMLNLDCKYTAHLPQCLVLLNTPTPSIQNCRVEMLGALLCTFSSAGLLVLEGLLDLCWKSTAALPRKFGKQNVGWNWAVS